MLISPLLCAQTIPPTNELENKEDRHQTTVMIRILPVLIISVHNADRVSSAQLLSQTRFTTPRAPWIDPSSQDPKQGSDIGNWLVPNVQS